MKHVESREFWQVVENIDHAPLGSRPVVEMDLQEDGCYTEVSVNGRTVGEEISCYRSGRTRCYLTEEF